MAVSPDVLNDQRPTDAQVRSRLARDFRAADLRRLEPSLVPIVVAWRGRPPFLATGVFAVDDQLLAAYRRTMGGQVKSAPTKGWRRTGAEELQATVAAQRETQEAEARWRKEREEQLKDHPWFKKKGLVAQRGWRAQRAFPPDLRARIEAVMPAAEQEACTGRFGVKMDPTSARYACWAVSAHLAEVLAAWGFDAQVVQGYFDGVPDYYHEWVELNLGGVTWIIDGTRNQFFGDDPKLLIRRKELDDDEYRTAADKCYVCGDVGHLDEDCSR